jgi:hypothetical protein
MMTKEQKEAIKAAKIGDYNDHVLVLPAFIELAETIAKNDAGFTEQALIMALSGMDIPESARMFMALKVGRFPPMLSSIGLAAMRDGCRREGIEVGE